MPIAPIRIVISGVDKFSNKIATVNKKLDKIGKNAANIGRKLTLGVTLPVLAMGGAALKTTADFEQSMLRVQNLSGATGQQFESMERQARDLGATTLHTASAAAEGMGFLAMAGFDTNQIMSAIPATLDLATAAQIDLGRSADIVSNVLTGYNKKATETNMVVDLMADTMNSANTNMEQLAEAMKFVGPVASGMKIPIEDTATAIGLLSNAGIQGAMAGTQLRGILGMLADPTNEARKTLARLQIPKENIIDAQGNVKNLGDVIASFEKSGATTADMLQIFGRRIGPGMAALVSQGSSAFQKLNKDLRDNQGEARKSASAYEESFIGQIKAMQSALQELGIAIFKDTGILKDLTMFVKKLIGVVRNVAKVNPGLLKMGAIFAGILAAVGPLLMVIGPLISGIATLATAISSAGGVIALLSNPIGWVIAGIMALVGVITYMVTHSNSKLTKLLSYFFPLGGVVTWIITRWKRILPFIKLTVYGILWLLKKFAKLVRPIVQPIIDLFAFLGDLIFRGLDKALSGLEKLAGLALPKWLQDKIGLTTGEVTASQGGTALVERTGAIIGKNENTTNIRIENKANASVRTQTDSGTVNMEVDRGLLFQGAF